MKNIVFALLTLILTVFLVSALNMKLGPVAAVREIL